MQRIVYRLETIVFFAHVNRNFEPPFLDSRLESRNLAVAPAVCYLSGVSGIDATGCDPRVSVMTFLELRIAAYEMPTVNFRQI